MPSLPLTDKFIPAFTFQEVIFNKDTGFPLASGIVTFYEDTQRTTLKDVYQITGLPGNYTITQLPNPITLSSIGTFQDNSGNDIVPYFFPYDASGQPDYYYVTVYSSDDGVTPDVLQFTREHVPYIEGAGGSSDLTNIKNYIPDGQFLIHNDVLNINNNVSLLPGQIVDAITYLAPNGWTYERTVGSTAIDTVTFVEIPITNIPVGNPRYACNLVCDTPSGTDTYKYLAINFSDVNKFANNKTYTLSFSAVSSSNTIVVIKARKNFGTGGSAEELQALGVPQHITATETMFNISFSLGSNIGKTLGTAGDDFCSFIISFPTSLAFNVTVTDFMLTEGTATFDDFLVTTNSEFSYETISGSLPVPNYQGMNYYLPRVLTEQGEIYDDSMIGEPYASSKVFLEKTELLCDGNFYDTDKFDSRTKIPYRRLYLKWANPANGKCIYGNGQTFYLTASNTGTNVVTLTGNATYNLNVVQGAISTGFTITDLGGSHNVWHVTTIAGSSITDGSYFTFYDTGSTHYYVWMKGSSASVDPKPAGFLLRIVCEYLSTDTDVQIADKLMRAINSKWLQLPDLRGEFLRGWADGSSNDPDRATRTNRGDGAGGDAVGSKQPWQIQQHLHSVTTYITEREVGGVNCYSPDYGTSTSFNTNNTGGNQTNPINTYVMWVVRY